MIDTYLHDKDNINDFLIDYNLELPYSIKLDNGEILYLTNVLGNNEVLVFFNENNSHPITITNYNYNTREFKVGTKIYYYDEINDEEVVSKISNIYYTHPDVNRIDDKTIYYEKLNTLNLYLNDFNLLSGKYKVNIPYKIKNFYQYNLINIFGRIMQD